VLQDFTKSNEWKGGVCFGGRSLHHIDANTRNPYEQALHSLCTALASFNDTEHYMCVGFGDVTSKDQAVFSFFPRGTPAEGLQGVLKRYRQLAPYVRLAGPTSFAACIREVSVEKNSRQCKSARHQLALCGEVPK
jgi:E3 ubiquitin-protein ligase RGLG